MSIRPQHRRYRPRFRREGLLAMLATLLALVIGASMASAYTPATGSWPNYPGDGKYRGITSSIDPWAGNYAVKPSGSSTFDIAYCMDPYGDGPSSGGQYSVITHRTALHRTLANGSTSAMTAAQVDQTSYILWRWGATSNASQAAAVDAATYTTEGYGNYNVMDSTSWGYKRAKAAGVLATAQAYVTDARKYAGPYHVSVSLSQASPTVGSSVTVTAHLLTAAGVAVPNLSGVVITFDGKSVTTTAGPAGNAVATFTVPAAGAWSAKATFGNVAPTWLAAASPAVASAQTMLFVGDSTTATGSASGSAVKATPKLVTTVPHATVTAPASITDTITVSNWLAGDKETATATLWGPYATKPTSTDCQAAQKVGSVTVAISANGTVTTPAINVTNQGYYTFTEHLGGDSNVNAVTTACGIAQETTLASASPPSMVTTASEQSGKVGDSVTDSIAVSDTGGATVPIDWTLLGPVAPDAGSCSGLDWSTAATAASGQVTANGDGTVVTSPFTLPSTGCYTYVENAEQTATTGPAATSPGDTAETILAAAGTPVFITHASTQNAAAGSSVHDSINVTGTGGATLAIDWSLLGPVAPIGGSCSSVSFTGAAVDASGTVTAAGDGTYNTGSTVLKTTGCYTYVETAAATPTTTTVTTTPGTPAETVLVNQHTPAFSTNANHQHVLVGAGLSDNIHVSGLLTGDKVPVKWTLYGPLAPNAKGTCTGLSWAKAPVDKTGVVTATTNGTIKTALTKVNRVGCYTFAETAAATTSTTAAGTKPGVSVETVLVTRPPVVTIPPIPTGGVGVISSGRGLGELWGATLGGLAGLMLAGLGLAASRRRKAGELA